MSASFISDQLPAAPRLAPAMSSFLATERDDLMANLNTHSCWVHHRLSDHPLFEMPRLLQCAKELPAKYVRISSGAVPVHATPDQIPGNGLSMEESFAHIGDSDTRIMLKKIELVPEYRDLLYT